MTGTIIFANFGGKWVSPPFTKITSCLYAFELPSIYLYPEAYYTYILKKYMVLINAV